MISNTGISLENTLMVKQL